MTRQTSEHSSRLPAVAPDLVVAERPAGWQVVAVSPLVVRLLSLSAAEAPGRDLRQLFREVRPDLEDLAREVAEREAPLLAIPVRFPAAGQTPLMADIRPGGRTEDLRSRRVLFSFRPGTTPAVAGGDRHGLIGESPAIREVLRKIELYAPSEAAVVITGETGTGKELVARALHERSQRRTSPFVAINCSAISEDLLESELFGHEKGAFTGAIRSHRGRFERADRGTLFLDEIGDMPLITQTRLLRVLEEGTIERVGGEEEKSVDVRVVAATHVRLEQAVSQGRFRADLYHRLAVLRIHMPALRERLEDIPPLVDHFLRLFQRRYDRPGKRLTPEAVSLLQSYLWPGNIRELRNVLERVFVENRSEVIGARAFAEWIRERQDFTPGDWGLDTQATAPGPLIPPYPLAGSRPLLDAPPPGLPAVRLPAAVSLRPSTRPAELDAGEIRRAFRAARGNLSAAARLLGVHRATLYRYLLRLGLDRSDLENP